MSMEAITRFWSAVGVGDAVAAEFDALLGRSERVPADDIIALGQRHGFAFTVDELRFALGRAAGIELSDADLEAVAGGGKWYVPEFGFKCEVDGQFQSAKLTGPSATGIITF